MAHSFLTILEPWLLWPGSASPSVSTWAERGGHPPAVLLASRGHARGGPICLAWTEVCEFPVTGQTCPRGPLLCRAAEPPGSGSPRSLTPSPAVRAPDICSRGAALFTRFVSAAAGPSDPGSAQLFSLLQGERKSFLVLKTSAQRAKSLTEFRKSIF